MEPILGFAPDAPWGTLGALRDCTAMLPYKNGLQQTTLWESAGLGSLPATPTYAGMFNSYIIASTQVTAVPKLYAYIGSWTNVSRVANYTAQHGSIVSFGTYTLACNGSGGDVIQSTANVFTTNFADQATAPKAGVLLSATASSGGFVLAFDTQDAGFGTSTDRWWCCAINDPTSWTISTATQATSGRLINGTGPIIAAANVSGDVICAFKADTMFVGRYVGPPAVWNWQEIVGYGCLGKNAVCSMNGQVFFASKDGLFIFDGAQVRPVGNGSIFQYWRDAVTARNPSYRASTFCQFDKFRNHVRIYYGDSLYVDKCLVINMDQGNIGLDYLPSANARIACPVNFVIGSADYLYVVGEDLTTYRQPTTYNAGTPASSITCGYVGSDRVVSDLYGFNLRYEKKPKTSVTPASCTAYTYVEPGGSATTLSAANSMDSPMGATNVFQLRSFGRWFSAKFNFAAASSASEYAKVIGVEADLKPRGKR